MADLLSRMTEDTVVKDALKVLPLVLGAIITGTTDFNTEEIMHNIGRFQDQQIKKQSQFTYMAECFAQ